MKNKTTKKPKVSPKKVVKVRSRRAHTPTKKLTAKQQMAMMKALGAIRAKAEAKRDLPPNTYMKSADDPAQQKKAKREPGRFVVTVPAPPAAPTYSAPWRAGIDWVAAGKKAHETRLRNLAARQADTAAQPPSVQAAARALDVALQADKKNRRSKFKKQMAAAPSVALKEEDTSRS